MVTRLGYETNKKTQIGLSCDVELWPRAGAKRRNCEQQRTDKEMPRCMVVLAAEGTERQCSRVLDKKKPDAWEHLFLAAMRMEMYPYWCENDVSIPTGCTCRPLSTPDSVATFGKVGSAQVPVPVQVPATATVAAKASTLAKR